MQGEYLELRGLVRQRGVLAATPVEVIENIQQYFHDVSSAMPGAHDEATNPADRSEKRQKHALFGAARKHCDRYTSRQRQVQQQQWEQQQIDVFDPSSIYAVSTLLHSASDPAFMLVSVCGQPRQFNPGVDHVL